jgi:hypothetical protein
VFLPAILGAGLVRLQRYNQQRVLAAIGSHHLTWRETRKVVSALESQPSWAHGQILRDPRQAIRGSGNDLVLAPEEESGLGLEAKGLRRKLFSFERMCLETALLFSGIELGQFETGEEKKLRAACCQAIDSLTRVEQELRKCKGGGDGTFHSEPAGS